MHLRDDAKLRTKFPMSKSSDVFWSAVVHIDARVLLVCRF